MAIHLLVLLTILTHLGFAGSRLAVPLLAVDQGASAFLVGSIVALYALFPTVLALPAGRMADRVGFRIPLVFGTGAILAALLVPYAWPTLTALYFTACVLGLGFMAFQLATQTLAGAIAGPSERTRNFSLLSLAFALGNFGGPLIAGALIDAVGYAHTFLALAVPLVPAAVLAVSSRRWLAEVRVKAESASGGALDLLRIAPLRNTLIAGGIVATAWDVYQFVMPIYGAAIGLSATAIGVVMSAFGIAIILVRIVLPPIVRHTGEAQMLTYAMFIACAAFVLFPFFENPWPLAAASFLLGIGCGCGQPLSMSLIYNAAPRGRIGEATGLRLTVNQVTHLIVPLLFGGLGTAAGFTVVFLTNAGFLVAGGWLGLRSHARKSDAD
ncbi:MAG: MFS transporter [Betaproteobacteria bacterium]